LVGWDLGIERELLADACLKSFWPFLQHAFGLGPQNPSAYWLTEDVHKPLADWIEKIVFEWERMRKSGKPERFYILIDAARGSGKTWVITKGLTAWLHLRNPDLASVIDSVTISKAEEFAETLKRLYEAKDPYALFPWFYGKWEGNETWTKGRFTHRARKANKSEASIETSGVETGITGDHPDHLIIDDPITREKLREAGTWIQLANTHVISMFPACRNDSLVILCATPYLDGDVVSNAITVDGLKEVLGREFPGEYRCHLRKDGKWRAFYMPAADEEGNALMPLVWPKDQLDEYQRKSPSDYAAQVCLRPGTGEQVPLTMDQIKQCMIPRRDVPKTLSYTIHCDTAFKNKRTIGKGDWSVFEVWGHHPDTGDVYFMEGHGSSRWRSEEFTTRLLEVTQRYIKTGKRIRAITDEKSMGGKEGVWENHLRSCFSNAGLYLPPYFEFDRRGDVKINRMLVAAGYWVDGHVFLVEDAPSLTNLMWQMSRLGLLDHDDWADAAADVFHPDIYRPLRPVLNDAQPPSPRRPGDSYLQTGRIDNLEARDFYDNLIFEPNYAREVIR
jgi:hypothetical protein